MAPALTPAAAYRIASQWGSYISSGDPGGCMYGFRAGDGRPVSEAHRAQCLAYLDTLRPTTCEDLFDIGRLRRYLSVAPLATEARS